MMCEALFAPYSEVTALLQRFDIVLPRAALVDRVEDAVEFFNEINTPVAIKVISSHESHKSDHGLLTLNLNTAQLVADRAKVLLTKSSPLSVEGLLVQEMVPDGVEVLAGLVNDPMFGMMLMFGAGGTLVELLDEVILRLVPVERKEAQWLLKQHPIFRLLKGYRGRPESDWIALADLLVNLSRLGASLSDEIESLDINPVIVTPKGAFAVDYRMKRKDGCDDGKHS